MEVHGKGSVSGLRCLSGTAATWQYCRLPCLRGDKVRIEAGCDPDVVHALGDLERVYRLVQPAAAEIVPDRSRQLLGDRPLRLHWIRALPSEEVMPGSRQPLGRGSQQRFYPSPERREERTE